MFIIDTAELTSKFGEAHKRVFEEIFLVLILVLLFERDYVAVRDEIAGRSHEEKELIVKRFQKFSSISDFVFPDFLF